MKLAETFFVDGQPVGQIVQDAYTRQIAFKPRNGISPLPARDWRSVDELKAAVRAAYKKTPEPSQ